ncbi:MAG: metal-sensitive transcriptional regulator [Trueperaceae bacterium]
MDQSEVVTKEAAGSIPAAHDSDCLHLDDETRKDSVRRLKGARGHLEGVLRMLEDPDVYCVDVMKQLSAVQGAISKVNEKVLRSHIRDHVSTAILRGDTEHMVDELMEALKYRG